MRKNLQNIVPKFMWEWRESKWQKQGIQISWFQIQVIFTCPLFSPACISHCGAAINLTLMFFVLWKTILETLQQLKGFIIRLDMQYSNVAWKPNWTGNDLCILRPMPAHSKWITGGLSLFLRHSVLNLDRKNLQEAFIFSDFLPFVLYGPELNQTVRGLPPIKDDGNGNLGLFISEKKRAMGTKTSPFSICNMQHTEAIRVFL